MYVFFGYGPDHSGKINDDDLTYHGNVHYVLDRMHRVFQGSANDPADGYSKKFAKPAIACGDKGWVYIKPDDKDPNDPAGRPLKESLPDFKTTGAWHWKQRYLWVNGISTEQRPGICQEKVQAVTQWSYDLITFCDSVFAEDVWISSLKDTIEEGKKLDDLGVHALSRIIIHEFAHYYGFRGFSDQNKDGFQVDDHQAVGKAGNLLYLGSDGKKTPDSKDDKGQDNRKAITYFFTMVANLARKHEGENAGNTGPAKSTSTADAYAYFAMASYLDNFDWTTKGQAEKLPETPEDIQARSLFYRALQFWV